MCSRKASFNDIFDRSNIFICIQQKDIFYYPLFKKLLELKKSEDKSVQKSKVILNFSHGFSFLFAGSFHHDQFVLNIFNLVSQ